MGLLKLSRRYFLAGAMLAGWSFVECGVVWAEVRSPYGVAVIIGNRHYPHRDVPDVDYADRDAEAFRRYVVEVLGFDPKKVIYLEDAERRDMRNAFGSGGGAMSDLWAHLDPGGRSDVVVYYSGHGVPGLEDGKGYLLPVDVPPREAEDEGYPIEDLYARLGELREAREGRRARTVQVYLDACFSGSSYGGFLIQGASPVIIAAELPTGVAEDVTVLSAAGPKQIANWDEEARHGLFTHHLLDALYGKGDVDGDGKVTAGEAKRYLDDHMTPAAWLARRTEQRASLLSRSSGAVLLEAPVGGYPERPVLEAGKAGVAVSREKVVEQVVEPGGTVEGVVPRLGHEQAMYMLGMEEAFGGKDYGKVLEYGKELEELGGALPDEAYHYLGVAYFHLGRAGEAGAALKRYVERAGKDGRYYQGSLVVLLSVREKDEAAFAEAKRKGTLAGYEAYLSSWPGGRHRDEVEGFRASAREREAREEAERKEQWSTDDAAYEAARAADTVSAYAGYLLSYPEGRHVREAESRRRELEMAEHERLEAPLQLGRADRVLVQLGLESLGEDVGGADGVLGRRTRAGLRSWQREKGLEVTGTLTREQAEALIAIGREAEERKERESRAEAAEEAERRREEAARKEREAKAEAEKRRMAEERRVGRVFRDCGECPEMVVVPGGSFEMGSRDGDEDERPVHGVTIGESFAVGVYAVTFDEWEACVGEGGCGGYRLGDEGWGRGNRPVINVSWEDAQGYVSWLRGKTGAGYRLLSEAEWEYVARAGSRTAYHWGDSVGRNRANCDGCGSPWDAERTAPVGSFGANGFGLHDVHGNVWEWVEDCWNDSYVGAPSDGSAWESAWESGGCGRRVLRGGSWISAPGNLRSAFRFRNSTWYQSNITGFRVARTLTP